MTSRNDGIYAAVIDETQQLTEVCQAPVAGFAGIGQIRRASGELPGVLQRLVPCDFTEMIGILEPYQVRHGVRYCAVTIVLKTACGKHESSLVLRVLPRSLRRYHVAAQPVGLLLACLQNGRISSRRRALVED